MARSMFTSRSGGKSYQSLQFESSVLGGKSRSRSYSYSSNRSSRPRIVPAACVAGAILLGLWAWSQMPDDNRALGKMALEVYNGLHAGAAPEAAAAQAGLGLFSGESKALAKSDSLPDAFTADNVLVNKIRADLQAAGVKWEAARPLAFGGVKAKVADAAAPEEGVVVVTGNVYFAAGERVYALEVSAERLDGAYVPTEIWQCVTLQAKADDLDILESHAKQGFAEFQSESPAPNALLRIVEAEPVFIAL